jgi:hypothetical protein
MLAAVEVAFASLAIASFVLVLLAHRSQAQTRYELRDHNGRHLGRTETYRDTVSIYDRNGRYEGKSVRDGARTEFFDRNSLFQGYARVRGPPSGKVRGN